MPSTRRVLHAFLASPGDLEEERKAIRDVVDEFNRLWADDLGYQVDLVGWEETVAGYGRPQHLINQDVDRCDLFIGMIWKRWGTPPDSEGNFSSGFEEEFQRSMDRRERTGRPQVSLFFKEIPEEFMTDPGDDLKRVLQFKETVMAERKILFQNFSTVRDMEERARQCVTEYVKDVKRADTAAEADEDRARRPKTEPRDAENEESPGSSPLSAEGFGFVKDLVKRLGHESAMANLSASDVARFRLLANSIAKPGNDELDLGVHDINILFSEYAKGLKLGQRELRCLVKLGFQNYSYENVPVWCWYSAITDSSLDPAFVSAAIGANDDEKVGAIRVLSALERQLPEDDENQTRNKIIGIWFSKESSKHVKSAALDYLAKNGTAGDLDVVRREYDRSDSETSRTALQCTLEILLRTGASKAAQEIVLATQFVSLDRSILNAVLDRFKDVGTEELVLGLEHRNAEVRRRALNVLFSRGSLDRTVAERLTKDSDALVRNEAITALSGLGRVFTEAEVRGILVPPQKTTLLGLQGPDKRGEDLFAQYQVESLEQVAEAELTQRIADSLVVEDAAYFVRADRYFVNHVKELRQDVDDRFIGHFEEVIRRLESALGHLDSGKELVKRLRDHGESSRKKLTRQGLDILCRAGEHEDLWRVRDNLRNGFAGPSMADAEFLETHGEWSDIPLLVNAEGWKRGETLITTTNDDEVLRCVAKAILAMSQRYPFARLVDIELPAEILKGVILLCTEPAFLAMSDQDLLRLFDHEEEGVRKAAAMVAVRIFPAQRIKSILHKYIDSDKDQYYNVVHWLDLGASMSRDEAQKVVRAAAD